MQKCPDCGKKLPKVNKLTGNAIKYCPYCGEHLECLSCADDRCYDCDRGPKGDCCCGQYAKHPEKWE